MIKITEHLGYAYQVDNKLIVLYFINDNYCLWVGKV